MKGRYITMIIVGYPCIGKSTSAKNPYDEEFKYKVIDLESSYFKPGGKNHEGWVDNYCAMAKELSDNGHIVFVSSHKDVVDKLYNSVSVFEFCLIYPGLPLKDAWVQKAKDRWNETQLSKDLRSYERIMNHYEEDIGALMKRSNFNPYHIIIKDINYDLEELIKGWINRQERFRE